MPKTDRVKIQSWQAGEDGQRYFGWVEVNVLEALRKGEKYGRCIECGQPVTVFEASPEFAAHPEHRKRNLNCSLSDRR